MPDQLDPGPHVLGKRISADEAKRPSLGESLMMATGARQPRCTRTAADLVIQQEDRASGSITIPAPRA
jgi:hypothetical protein